MDRLERFYRLNDLFKARRCLSFVALQETLEVSRATLRRDLEYLRDRLHAPLVFDRGRRGYRYDFSIAGADRYDLPGVWFSPAEIHALVVAHGLLAQLGSGLLEGRVAPLIGRLEKLLEDHRLPAADVHRRIRLLNVAHRGALPEHFGVAAQAVLQRQRLRLDHQHRGEARVTSREVSPQRLVYYRGTWYLDAWCHLRDGLRAFALDAVVRLEAVDGPVREVPEADLHAHFGGGYGIFSGPAAHTAVLRFAPRAARWVRAEHWHPAQVGSDEADGSYRLEFPYGDDTELLMDILRHGAEVEVLAPPELRARVVTAARRMLDRYGC